MNCSNLSQPINAEQSFQNLPQSLAGMEYIGVLLPQNNFLGDNSAEFQWPLNKNILLHIHVDDPILLIHSNNQADREFSFQPYKNDL